MVQRAFSGRGVSGTREEKYPSEPNLHLPFQKTCFPSPRALKPLLFYDLIPALISSWPFET
jgi:hypothetical protein